MEQYKMATEDDIFGCFAAAQKGATTLDSVESFLDVEMYENQTMYPAFARWADKAGYPDIAKLFLKVAGEEKMHATWITELYKTHATPKEFRDVTRAKSALKKVNDNLKELARTKPDLLLERALKVAYRVECREAEEIYPGLRDQAKAEGNDAAVAVYQRVIDSEQQHASWFAAALDNLKSAKAVAAQA